MKCPICGQETKDNANFCQKCGKKIPRCPSCGKVITKKMRFCIHDGTPLPPEIMELLPDKTNSVGTDDGKENNGKIAVNPVLSEDKPRLTDADPLAPVRTESSVKEPSQTNKISPVMLILICAAAIVFISLCAFGGYMAASGKFSSLFGQADIEHDIEDDKELLNDGKADRSNSKNDEDNEEELQDKVTTAEETTAAPAAETTSAESSAAMTSAEATTAFAAAENMGPEDKLLYFIENSDRETFAVEYLEDFDANMCRLARNGIYARLGRKFKDAAIMEYFGQYDWYNPSIEPENFSDNMLNSYQVANRDLIVAYEEQKGYNK